MSFSINNFMHNMDNHSGGSKPDRFYAQFSLPLALQLNSHVTDLTFQCHSGEIPGVTLHTNTYKSYGPGKTIPTVKIYNEITFSFYCTNDFYEKPLFDSWIEYINPSSLGWDFRYKDEYVTSIDVSQLSLTSDIPIFTVQLIRAYPISVFPLALKWSNGNIIHSLDVTFVYDRYAITSQNNIINKIWNGFSNGVDAGNLFNNVVLNQ